MALLTVVLAHQQAGTALFSPLKCCRILLTGGFQSARWNDENGSCLGWANERLAGERSDCFHTLFRRSTGDNRMIAECSPGIPNIGSRPSVLACDDVALTHIHTKGPRERRGSEAERGMMCD